MPRLTRYTDDHNISGLENGSELLVLKKKVHFSLQEEMTEHKKNKPFGHTIIIRKHPTQEWSPFLAFMEAGTDYNSAMEALAGQETVNNRGEGLLPLPFSSHYAAIQGPRDLVLNV